MACKRDYKAIHNSGRRSTEGLKWIIVHDTEGDSARGTASWFTNPASGGSTQLVVDDNECYRTLDDDVIPWGAVGANTLGLHIEQAGHAAWSRAQWMHHHLTIERCAYHVAQWCRQYGIPAEILTSAEMRAGKKGIATHATVTAAFKQDTHTDPGPNYPMDVLLHKVKEHLGGKH